MNQRNCASMRNPIHIFGTYVGLHWNNGTGFIYMSSKIQHWNSEFSLLPTENTSQNSFGYGIIRKTNGARTVDRSKLGKLMLLFLALPFAAYLLIDCIAGYIPPSESYKKTPYQFEAAFNEQMAQYGMSIDIDSVNFTYGDSLSKTIPVVCEDGSKITCTYFPTSERRKSLIEYITFEQELTGDTSDAVYIETLLKFMLDEFETVITENKDESLNPVVGVSYNEALRICKEFVGSDEQEVVFSVFPAELNGAGVILERKTEGEVVLSISLYL